MFSNYLSSIEGVEIIAISVLIFFFTIFIGLIYWVVKLDKSFIEVMEYLPLENNNHLEIKSESENAKSE